MLKSLRALAPQILLTGSLLLLASSALPATEFHLVEGSVRGAWIGEADGVIHVLTEEGKKVEVDRNDLVWIDWSVEVPPKMGKRVIREREKFIKKRRKVARQLMKTLEKSDEPERPSIIAKFDGFDEAQSLHAFSDGLGSKVGHVRELSFERLASFESPAAVVPFVRVSLKSKDPEFAARALKQAREMNPEMSVRLFEHVAHSASMPYRTKAVETLGSLQDDSALPGLVRVLHYVGIDIRATVGRTKRIDTLPINLGSTSAAATNVEIDLPQLELIQVQSSLRIPVESLRRLESVTIKALETASGRSYGNDSHAWAKYVREKLAAQESDAKKD